MARLTDRRGWRANGVPRWRWGRLTSLRRPRRWTLLRSSLLMVVSASLDILTQADPRSAEGLIVAVAGVLMLGSAGLAWRGTRRTGPFGAALARVLNRVVTGLGMFFAVAPWARYAPHASAAFSRTIVVVLCTVGLIGGILATARSLNP